MLKISKLETGYGKKQVLFGPSLEVREGEIVALIGPNGAGKSTVLKAIFGLIPAWKGHICFNGDAANESSRDGNITKYITYAPQGGRVFADLTVAENLEVGGFRLLRKDLKKRIAQVFQIFPILKERAHQEAGKLSGGEQQILALARALVPKPKLLMFDEPSLGLSPNLVSAIFNKIVEINKETGVSILIVEQKVREVIDISNRVYSLKLGKIAFDGLPEELRENKQKLKELFL